jgi:hypothetical protein
MASTAAQTAAKTGETTGETGETTAGTVAAKPTRRTALRRARPTLACRCRSLFQVKATNRELFIHTAGTGAPATPQNTKINDRGIGSCRSAGHCTDPRAIAVPTPAASRC